MNAPTDSEDFTVIAKDVVAAGYCINPGLKGYLEARGFSLRDFIRNGLPAETFRSFNDAHSDRVLTKARERLNG